MSALTSKGEPSIAATRQIATRLSNGRNRWQQTFIARATRCLNAMRVATRPNLVVDGHASCKPRLMLHRFIAYFALILLVGCAANISPRTRRARVLVTAGVLTATVGGLATAGCFDVSGTGRGCANIAGDQEERCVDHGTSHRCAGGPTGADLALGLPLIALGVGLVAGGLVMKPFGKSVAGPGGRSSLGGSGDLVGGTLLQHFRPAARAESANLPNR